MLKASDSPLCASCFIMPFDVGSLDMCYYLEINDPSARIKQSGQNRSKPMQKTQPEKKTLPMFHQNMNPILLGHRVGYNPL